MILSLQSNAKGLPKGEAARRIRTRRPFFRSLPGRLLSMATLVVGAVAILLPFTPLGTLFEFRPIPIEFIALMGAIIFLYVLSAEAAKRLFYRRMALPARIG